MFPFILGVCVFGLLVCLSTMCEQRTEARRGHWIPWNGSYRCEPPYGVLRIEPRSSRRAARALNHWTTSPAQFLSLFISTNIYLITLLMRFRIPSDSLSSKFLKKDHSRDCSILIDCYCHPLFWLSHP